MKFSTRVAQFVMIGSLWIGAAHFLSGCSSEKVNENDPASVFKDAEDDIKNDRYLLALDKLRVIKSKFSYTSYGALAQLRMGDVYFLQESYPEASAAYETFVELYPKHEKAGYAQFRVGESYFLDIPTIVERDLKSAESAIQAYTTYLKRYPNGEFEKVAHEHKATAYNKLAEKELTIAQFYIRKKKYDAARTRLQKVINQYGDSPSAPQAMNTLKEMPNTTSAAQ